MTPAGNIEAGVLFLSDYWAELVRPVRQKAFNWRKSDGNRAAALREAKAAQELAKMGQMALQIAEALRPG